MEVKGKLVIHMDINNTCVMQDNADGLDVKHTVSLILAKQSWGLKAYDGEITVWRISHPEVCLDRPRADMISYHEYILELLHDISSEEEHQELARKELNDEQQKKLLNRISKFTEAGYPGESLQGLHNKLVEILTVPSLESNEQNDRLFSKGQMLLIPSFFYLIRELLISHRDFVLIFRTFGAELSLVIQEVNFFIEGFHPVYNKSNPDFSELFRMNLITNDFKIHSQHKGCFCRDSSTSYLVFGTADRYPHMLDPDLSSIPGCPQLSIYEGFPAIYSELKKRIACSKFLALSDDYFHWESQGQTEDQGKPLLINQNDPEVPIFFDDNMTETCCKTILVYDMIANEKIPFNSCANKYLIRVDPFKSISDPLYFCKLLDLTISINS